MRSVVLMSLLAACSLDDELSLSTTESDLFVWGTGSWFEMEAASTAGAMQVASDPSSASGGNYLAANGAGYGRFFLEVENAENYVLWFRVIAPPGSSLDVQLGGVTQHWDLPAAQHWTWLSVTSPSGERGSWELEAANHELRITASTGGVRLDRALITSNRSFTPIAHVIEAEQGSVVAPMRIASQKIPSATFAWVPNGAGNYGRLDLDVDVPAGVYKVWGRANAPSTADNRFSISVGRSIFSRSWEPPVTSSTGWTWSEVARTIEFDGMDILAVHQGEDGTKLDKIVITNDWEFWLVERSPPPQSSL